MAQSDLPIIISGGSVSIDFDESQFQSSGKGRYKNANKKIKRIEITGDGINLDENIPDGKVTIKIHYGNP